MEVQKRKQMKEKSVRNTNSVVTFCLETGSVDMDFRESGLDENYDLIDDLMDVLLKYGSPEEEAE